MRRRQGSPVTRILQCVKMSMKRTTILAYTNDLAATHCESIMLLALKWQFIDVMDYGPPCKTFTHLVLEWTLVTPIDRIQEFIVCTNMRKIRLVGSTEFEHWTLAQKLEENLEHYLRWNISQWRMMIISDVNDSLLLEKFLEYLPFSICINYPKYPHLYHCPKYESIGTRKSFRR